MRIRNSSLYLAGLCAMLGAASAFGQTLDRQSRRPSDRADIAKVGEPAPNFTLNDASGKSHTLADYRGKLVVLQWINPDCPICTRVNRSGITTEMTKAIRAIAKDFVHLTIHSTHYMELDKSVAYLKQHKVKATVLDDRDGKVGHLYGAKTTPHMYVIDEKGILRYAGAIDNDDNGKNRDGATNYVINAVRQIAAGETVAPDLTKSYGCAIKYDPNAAKRERPARGQRGDRQGRGGRGGFGFGGAQMLDRLDTNGDGKIDADELSELPQRMKDRILEADTNGDGAVDESELKAMEEARHQRLLERYDKDGDGKLSDEEREAMRQDRPGSRRGGRGGDGGAS
ncbi:MAG: redoxin domain-containing protein [Planctomycetes bacterium]|nr:redoxin domain-containing protein [Planctomycetota bacterium]